MRICKKCKSEYEPNSNVQKFCSAECRYQDELVRYKDRRPAYDKKAREKNPEKYLVRNRAYYQQHKEELNEYHRKHYQFIKDDADYKEKRKIISKRYYDNNKDKASARGKLGKSVLRGKIKKLDRCELCDSTKNIEGHHEDYTKPLDVIWLCRDCHKNQKTKELIKHINNYRK